MASSQALTLGLHLVVIQSPAEACIRLAQAGPRTDACSGQGGYRLDTGQGGTQNEGGWGPWPGVRQTLTLSEVAACQLPAPLTMPPVDGV